MVCTFIILITSVVTNGSLLIDKFLSVVNVFNSAVVTYKVE